MSYFDSTDRTTVDFVLFALGFVGFLLATTGVIVGCPPGALTGVGFLLLAILCLSLRSAPGE
jgi:hypothetical protein